MLLQTELLTVCTSSVQDHIYTNHTAALNRQHKILSSG